MKVIKIETAVKSVLKIFKKKKKESKMSTIFKPISKDEIKERKKKWEELQGWKDRYRYVYDFSEGLVRVLNTKDLYGFVNEEGEEVIECKYRYVGYFREGLAKVMNQEYLWGFINKRGEEVIECKYRDIDDFSEGLAGIGNKNGFYGFINKKGEEVIKCKYTWIWSFYNEKSKVELNNKKYYIDKEGKRVDE